MSDLTRFTDSQTSGELAGLLIASLLEHISGVARQQASNAFSVLGIQLKKDRELVHRLTQLSDDNLEARLARLAVLIVNYGAILSKERVGYDRLLTGLGKVDQTQTVIIKLFEAGQKAWAGEQLRIKKLLGSNLIKLSHQTAWLSLFTADDETALKDYYLEPPRTLVDRDRRGHCYDRLALLVKLAAALAIPILYSNGITYYNPSFPSERISDHFPELAYIRLVAARGDTRLTTTREGILTPTIGSLLMRLLVAVAKQDELWKQNFARDSGDGKLVFREAKAAFSDQERADILSQTNLMTRRTVFTNRLAINTEEMVKALRGCFVVNLEVCRDFLILLHEPGVIDQHLPLAAEGIQAILESAVWTLAGIAPDRPSLTDDDLAALTPEFVNQVAKLKEEIELFFTEQELRSGETFNEQAATFWQRRVLLAVDNTKLLARDRPLTVDQICALTDFDAVALHLSNFDTWPIGAQTELIRRYPWQLLIERGEANHFWKIYRLLRPDRQISDAGELPENPVHVARWDAVWRQLNWKRAYPGFIEGVWELSSTHDSPLNDYLRRAAAVVTLTVPRLKAVTWPLRRENDLPLETIAARWPFLDLWFDRLTRDGELNWSKMSVETLDRWLQETQDSVAYWAVLQRADPRRVAQILRRFVAGVEYCPSDKQLFPAWAKIIVAMEELARSGRVVATTVAGTTWSSPAVAKWYQATLNRSEKNAALCRIQLRNL